MSKGLIRLEEFLASQTPLSRRDILNLVRHHEVMINGHVVTSLVKRLNPMSDVVHVSGERVEYSLSYVYYKFYKPVGVISTMEDPSGRRCLGDLMRRVPQAMAPVGRLDRDTEGLMLFTNDGELAHHLAHPRFHIPKRYRVTLDQSVTEYLLTRLESGIFLEDGPVLLDAFEVISHQTLEIQLSEGRNRIIRRTFACLGFEVKRLKRLAIGPIQLGKLRVGEWAPLTKSEWQQLQKALAQSVDV